MKKNKHNDEKNKICRKKDKKARPKRNTSEVIQCYMYLLLPMIGFLVMTVYPILWSMRWSFFSYNMVPSETRFVGLDNFIRIFTTDFTYWKVWGNTLLFAVLKIPIETCIAILIAVVLSSKRVKGAGFFRTFYFLPNVISLVIVGLIFSNIFQFQGLINTWLVKIGVLERGVDWFGSRAAALTTLLTASIWTSFGINVMYFVAALSNVPMELYESAKLDGASVWAEFSKITFPCILPVFKTILLLSIVGTLGINDLILVLTAGGPNMTTHSVMSYLTQTFLPGFSGNAPALGYGCAMSLITTVIFAAVGIGYHMLSNKLSEDTI